MADARRIKGVTSVHADQGAARLTLKFDPSQTDDGAVARALQAILDRLD